MKDYSKRNGRGAAAIQEQLEAGAQMPTIITHGDTVIVPDTQVQAGTPLDHIEALARYIVKRRPANIVHIGDAYDLKALSSYADRAEREGLRLLDDLTHGNKALAIIPKAIAAYNKRAKKKVYRPNLILTLGNHEHRLNRYLGEHPELEGIIDLPKHVKRAGWQLVPFLQPVMIDGVMYIHYLPNPMSGRPIGGTVENKLNKIPHSFVHGHQQHLQFGRRQTMTGTHHFGVVAGSFYQHDEPYRGANNTEWRGFVHLKRFVNRYGNEDFDVQPISLEALLAQY